MFTSRGVFSTQTTKTEFFAKIGDGFYVSLGFGCASGLSNFFNYSNFLQRIFYYLLYFHNSLVIRQKGKSQNECFKKAKHAKISGKKNFLPPDTHTCVKCLFFGNFGVLCFLETPVLRFALLPYSRRTSGFQLNIIYLLVRHCTLYSFKLLGLTPCCQMLFALRVFSVVFSGGILP